MPEAPPSRSLPKTIFLVLELAAFSSLILYKARGFAPAGATGGFPIASGRFGPPLDDKPIQTGAEGVAGAIGKPPPRAAARNSHAGDVMF